MNDTRQKAMTVRDRLRPPYSSMVARILALIVLAVLFVAAQSPLLSRSERDQLVARFSFASAPLPQVAGAPIQQMRPVHPGLERIASWISAIGASVALSDIDGDGLPNDACYVDTRTNQVIVAPVPGSGDRYAPFALDFSGFAFDATMAPMACLPGNFKEDQYTDLLVYFWGRTPRRIPPSRHLSRAQPQELRSPGNRLWWGAVVP